VSLKQVQNRYQVSLLPNRAMLWEWQASGSEWLPGRAFLLSGERESDMVKVAVEMAMGVALGRGVCRDD
jgi:hypothetical protein